MAAMTFVRRLGVFLLLTIGLALGASAGELAERPDGLHTQPWFKTLSFLDIADDVAEAKAEGKLLVILFEQPGCDSCERLHEVNFADPDLVAYVNRHFEVIQINLYGEVAVTRRDGSETNEKGLAQDFRIHFTPTTVFLDEQGAEVFRVPGYFRPTHYRAAFEYVVDGAWQRGELFPRWLKVRRSS